MTEEIRKSTHLGIAWKFRNGRNLASARVHAVVRPEGVSSIQLPTGGVGWNKPWRRVCDGGPADERRLGWIDDVTCKECRRELR